MAKPTNSPVTSAIALTDRSTKALTAAATSVEKTVTGTVTSLQKAVDEVTKAVATQSEALASVTYEVEVKSAELSALEEQYVTRRREAEADLALELKEARDQTITKVLNDLGKVSVSNDDLQRLRSAADNNEQELQQAVSKAAAAAGEKGKAEGERLAMQAKSDAALASASLQAEITSLKAQLDYSNSTVKDLREQITAEREARIKEAQARGQSQVTVNSSK